jgi:excisionase family DNA binding protein
MTDGVLAMLARLDARLERVERQLQLGVAREAYTVAQAAERLNLSAWTVRQACNKGRIHGTKARNGRDWRIPHDELVRVEAEGLPSHD